MEFGGVSDGTTVFNPTNHAYFNLSGDPEKLVDQHLLQLAADSFVETDEASIPTGQLISVAGTDYDFLNEREIGAFSYDNCYVGSKAKLTDPSSGRHMVVESTFPGIQLYTGNFLEGTGFHNRAGVCLETQFFPDSPNHHHFPSTVLKKGQVFNQTTRLQFSVK